MATAVHDWQNLSALIRCQFIELREELVQELRKALLDARPAERFSAQSAESAFSRYREAPSGEESVHSEGEHFHPNDSQECHDWLKRHRKSFLSSKIVAMLEDEERTHGMMVNLPSLADREHREHREHRVHPAPPSGPLPETLRLAAVEELRTNVSEGSPQASRSYHSATRGSTPKRPTRASVMEWAFGLKRQGSTRFQETSWLRMRVLRLVSSSFFESLSTVMLLANAVAVGVQTDYMAVKQAPSAPKVWRGMDMFFCVFFSLELTLRLAAFGKKFFVMTGCAWNVLDIILVLAQVTEELLLAVAADSDGQHNADVMRAVRILRVIKVLRLVGTVRMAEDLQLLINCLLLSLKQFVWSVLLLLLAIYVMAVYVTQAATAYRIEQPSGTYAEQISRWWGSMPQSILSLFQGITGGIDWHQIAEPLMKGISPWFGLLFVFFMAFCILALLNVITGTFVETMSQQAKDLHLRGRIVQARRLFREIDTDASGFISPDEILEHTSNPAVQEFFETIDVHPSEAKNLLEVIDLDGNGKINFEEFLEGSLRLNGAAKSSDLVLLAREVKRFHQGHAKEMSELLLKVRHALAEHRSQSGHGGRAKAVTEMC